MSRMTEADRLQLELSQSEIARLDMLIDKESHRHDRAMADLKGTRHRQGVMFEILRRRLDLGDVTLDEAVMAARVGGLGAKGQHADGQERSP